MSNTQLTAPSLRSSPATTASDVSVSAAGVLLALSFCHLLNDSIQALIPSLYPLLKRSFHLSFTQVGMITLTFQLVGSLLQPLVGHHTDKRPRPYSLVFGMGMTWCALIVLALAPTYHLVLVAAAMVGVGSAVFHPESSRMARLASGGRHGFAQSVFQVGGNAGTALGPLMAAWIIVPRGQRHILWFSALALTGMLILKSVGRWYQAHLADVARRGPQKTNEFTTIDKSKLVAALTVLLVLMFSKFFFTAAMVNYYTFYLIHRFGVSVQESQLYLFLFLAAGAAGTLAGGPIGDRIGRKQVIWLSILGVAPFALLFPHANLFWTAVLSMIVGSIMASAFPAILVYATELLPGKVGLVAGLFFGLAFGLAGIGSAVLGKLADATSIELVIKACSFLPLLGLFTWFLPGTEKARN